MSTIFTTLPSLLSFHTSLLISLPTYLSAFVGPSSISPATAETVNVTANSPTPSLPQCAYCTALHGNLARIAGVSNWSLFNDVGSEFAVKKLSHDPAARYARVHAELQGRDDPRLRAA